MAIEIHEILKIDLTDNAKVNVYGMTNTTGMVISHYAHSWKSTSATIPFSIEGVNNHVPHIDDVDFCVVIRKKVNLTATGPNSKVRKDVGEDKGKYKYVEESPTPPLDLPPGFTEVFKR